MSRKKLLYLAAFFALFVFVGHSFGTLLPQEPATEALKTAQSVMDTTFVEMPFGAPRSLARMAYGGNVFISIYFLVSGLLFILSARAQNFVKSIVLVNSLGLLASAVVTMICFFPLPAACAAIAGVLGLLAQRLP